METQTKPPVHANSNTEQGIQRESHHVSIDTTPKIHRYRQESQGRSSHTDVDNSDSIACTSFNLQNTNAPVPPKWKHNDHFLEEYKKFCHSCQCIFDGPMAHISNGKVLTNKFLIWCGPDGEDTYDNFNLDDNLKYDITYVMDQFEQYCEPICNFRAVMWKFR